MSRGGLDNEWLRVRRLLLLLHTKDAAAKNDDVQRHANRLGSPARDWLSAFSDHVRWMYHRAYHAGYARDAGKNAAWAWLVYAGALAPTTLGLDGVAHAIVAEYLRARPARG